MRYLKVLIDGCVFSVSDSGTPAKFWRLVTPRLAELLGKPVYFLNRSGTSPFQPSENLRILNAPPLDPKDLPGEQLRLTALCREIGANFFASTQYTTAAPVPSIFVLADDFPYLVNITGASLLARQSAIESASLCVTLSRQASEYLANGYQLPPQKICCLANGDPFADVELLSSKLVAAIKSVHG